MLRTWSLSLDDALVAIVAAQTRASELGLSIAVAMVEPGGGLLALQVMDGTQPAGADIALAKARAAAMFRRPTAAFEQVAQARAKPSVLLLPAAVDRALAVEGGLPILIGDGAVVGAVGVSGGSGAQDVDCATRAVQTVEEPVPARSPTPSDVSVRIEPT